jgi:hypothetical protein
MSDQSRRQPPGPQGTPTPEQRPEPQQRDQQQRDQRQQDQQQRQEQQDQQPPEPEEPRRPSAPDVRSRDADANQAVGDAAEQLFSGGDLPCDGEGTRDMLAKAYVKPPGYETARQVLQTSRVLVLAGSPGNGKETMGRALLFELGVDDIEEIDPFIEPRELLDRRFVGPRGYLVDSYDAEQAGRLRPFHPRTLKGALEPESFLVLTVDDPAAVRHLESGQVVACELPDHYQVLQRHVAWCLHRQDLRPDEVACLEGEPVRRYFAGDKRPMRAVRLARQLADDSQGELCDRLAAVLARLDDPVGQAAACLKDSDDHRHWSYMLALAVLPGHDRHLVADAAGRLATRLRPPNPDDDTAWTSGAFLPDRLRDAKAEDFDDQEITVGLGALPVRRIRFLNDSMPNAVLKFVWNGYDELRGPLCEWLDDLAGDSDVRLRRRAAVTVGFLSSYGFRYVHDRLLVPWATDGWARRETAALALGARAARREYIGQVRALLHTWTTSDDRELQRTAALAYGRLPGPDPGPALRDLRRIAQDDALQFQVAQSIADLVWFKGAVRILPELEEWTRDEPDQQLAVTGRLAFLTVAHLFEEPGPPRVGRWPVLLTQAEDDGQLRDLTATLWRRVLAHPDSGDWAGEALCFWTRAADTEAELADPEPPRLGPLLERLLVLVAAGGPADAGRLRFALNQHCAHDRDDPSETARRIADGIRQRGSDVDSHL